jgi:hypothetical protein
LEKKVFLRFINRDQIQTFWQARERKIFKNEIQKMKKRQSKMIFLSTPQTNPSFPHRKKQTIVFLFLIWPPFFFISNSKPFLKKQAQNNKLKT